MDELTWMPVEMATPLVLLLASRLVGMAQGVGASAVAVAELESFDLLGIRLDGPGTDRKQVYLLNPGGGEAIRLIALDLWESLS